MTVNPWSDIVQRVAESEESPPEDVENDLSIETRNIVERLSGHDDPEELFNEVWTRMLDFADRNPAEIEKIASSKEAFLAYFVGIARNSLADRHRKESRKLRDGHRDYADIPIESNASFMTDIEDFLDVHCSEEEHKLFTTIAIQGHGIAEAGNLLRMKPSTVYSKWQRLRKRLEEIWEE